MDKRAKLDGGGTENEEWVVASAKVMPSDPWWRHFDKNKIFTSIQEALTSLD